MKQIICDICGKPILESELNKKYRIQECVWCSTSFNTVWQEVDAHLYCMEEFMDLIRKKQKNKEG